MTKAQLLDSLNSRLDEPVRWNETEDDEFRWLLEVQRRVLRLARFDAIENIDDREELENIEWQLCAEDSRYFIENYVFIESPKMGKGRASMREMPFVLFESQDRMRREIEAAIDEASEGGEDNSITIVKPREIGASWLAQTIILHRFIFEPGFSAKCGSRTQGEVEDFTPESLMGKFRYMLERLPVFLRPDIAKDRQLHISSEDGSRITGEATTIGAFRGKRSSVLMLDEFAHVEARFQKRIYVGTDSVAGTRIFISTLNGPDNHFYQLTQGSDGPVVKLTWRDDPRRTEAWAEVRRVKMGLADFNQEYEGIVNTESGGLVWQARKTKTMYDDADPRFNVALRERGSLIVGWDFGSGASRLVSVWALVERLLNGKYRLWLDQELWWSRTGWREAAKDCHATKTDRYPMNPWQHVGDPSGVAPESNQESWESNLQAGKIPIQCLPYELGTQDQNDWGIKFVQTMMDDGMLMIHERCREMWDTIEKWRYATIKDTPIDEIDRKHIRPRHDKFSHHGMALVYLVHGALSIQQANMNPPEDPKAPPPRRSPAQEIAAILPARGLRGSAFSGTLGGR